MDGYSILKEELLGLINGSFGLIPLKITVYLYQLMHIDNSDTVFIPTMIYSYVTDKIWESSEPVEG